MFREGLPASRSRGSPDGRCGLAAGFGLERYAPAFRDNEIDWDSLPKLTAEDLRISAYCLAAIAASCKGSLSNGPRLW